MIVSSTSDGYTHIWSLLSVFEHTFVGGGHGKELASLKGEIEKIAAVDYDEEAEDADYYAGLAKQQAQSLLAKM